MYGRTIPAGRRPNFRQPLSKNHDECIEPTTHRLLYLLSFCLRYLPPYSGAVGLSKAYDEQAHDFRRHPACMYDGKWSKYCEQSGAFL